MLLGAMPVFVDTDRESFQIDHRKVEAAITSRTAAIMPVHLGGGVGDLDAILEIGRRRKIPVIEDACQAHLAEWKNAKVGTYGATGCFSFQASKNLNSGEGGAVLTNDDATASRLYSFHNNGRSNKTIGTADFSYFTNGGNFRLTEFQAALLLAQMTRLERQSDQRRDNGAYLTSLLKEIPGIAPARMPAGCTRNAFHLYMFRYDAARFAGLSRAAFLKALRAEGIPCSGGYTPLNQEPVFENALATRGFQRLFGKDAAANWRKRTQCPENDRLCTEAVWFTQNMLIGPRGDMDQIAGAVGKIQRSAKALL
jgi:dTDP-4-amino-4,6-dideoxygalactose transaminase